MSGRSPLTGRPPWIDRWRDTPGGRPCTCGHILGQHPADRFRSCSRCLWCDEFREEWRW